MKIIKGGVTAAKGFLTNGINCGIRKLKKDLAVIYTDAEAIVAGAFTKNIVKAAPVQLAIDKLKNRNKFKAVVINSGNANACTGLLGYEHAELICETAAKSLNVDSAEVYVCSTGVIGVILPIEKIVRGIKKIAPTLSSGLEVDNNASEAILTTDTRKKEIAVEIELAGKVVKIGGMSKGSGMIHPNMGTMLAFVTTDVAIDKKLLDKLVLEITDDTYNMITVDGDTSTNDTILVMANGLSGNQKITSKGQDYYKFKEALYFVNEYLAKEIIKDGEGATKMFEVAVKGGKNLAEVKKIALSVASSSLVKTAIFGSDANWGRIVCAMGYSKSHFDLNKIILKISDFTNSILLFEKGSPVAFSEEKALEILNKKELLIDIELNQGDISTKAWGCDLSYQYIKINGEYRS